jgi:hypothetical protein
MPSTEAPRPSPWLSLFLPLLVSAGGFAVQWGTLGADVRHLEGAYTKAEAQLTATNGALGALTTRTVAVEAEQLGTRRQMETELSGMRREMERMARALEKLTDGQARPASYRR